MQLLSSSKKQLTFNRKCRTKCAAFFCFKKYAVAVAFGAFALIPFANSSLAFALMSVAFALILRASALMSRASAFMPVCFAFA